MSLKVEEVLFVDTNIDTHIALPFYKTDTVADIKGKLMHEHLLRYPHLGPIVICAVKAEHRGNFYHLSDDMLVAPAFSQVKRICVLHADVSCTNHVSSGASTGNPALS